AGATMKPPDYRGAVPLVYYRPGSWKREVISDELEGVLHGVAAADWDGDGREDILTASFLGIDLFNFGNDRRWRRTRVGSGNPDPWPRCGSSEIAIGGLGADRVLCAIEPWHGNQGVVYLREEQGGRRRGI